MSDGLIVVGTTTLDAQVEIENVKALNYRVVLSGGGFNAAIGAADGQTPVHAITTLSPYGGIQTAIRHRLGERGIVVHSQPDGNPPLSHYDTKGALTAKKPSGQVRDNDNFYFDPMAIPGIEEITASAAVFVGGPTTFKGTRANLLNFAAHLNGKDIPVIVNHNPRSRVDHEVLRQWAEVAQIVTFSRGDVAYLFGGQTFSWTAAEEFLKWGIGKPCGTRLVVITDDTQPAVAHWANYNPRVGCHIFQQKCVEMPGSIISGQPDGAGDAFAAGVGLGYGRFYTTRQNDRLGVAFTSEEAENIVMAGHETAARLLHGKNEDHTSLGILRPLAELKGTLPDILCKLGYPLPK